MKHPTQEQIEEARAAGFAYDGRASFFCYLDAAAGLAEGEKYESTGWATMPGRCRLLERVVVCEGAAVHFPEGSLRCKRFDNGSEADAWAWACEKVAALVAGGFVVVTDEVRP